jgi:hypothetical protein
MQFAGFARLRLGWVHHLAKDDKRAVHELAAVITGTDRLLADAAADLIIDALPKGGTVAQAVALFDHVDGSQAADRLRGLASQYALVDMPVQAVPALRAAIARESDPKLICADRAEIVGASIQASNKADAELAIEEMRAALALADPTCASDAENAVWALAQAWRRLKVGKPRLVRAWMRAAELATTPAARALAEKTIQQLTRTERPSR